MSGVPIISIVDDDDFFRNSLDNLIRSVGFRVQGFSSAESFLNSDQVRDTACLILDVRMPGMSGLQLQRQIVAANWRIPIIFITSHADVRVRVDISTISGRHIVVTARRNQLFSLGAFCRAFLTSDKVRSETIHKKMMICRHRSDLVRDLFCLVA
jgi:CheY-like chemotaxis protein